MGDEFISQNPRLDRLLLYLIHLWEIYSSYYYLRNLAGCIFRQCVDLEKGKQDHWGDKSD